MSEPGIPVPRPATGDVLHLSTRHPAEDVEVLRATGVVDVDGATAFAEALRAVLGGDGRLVVLDLSGLSVLSTHGVVALLEAGHRALMRGMTLVLVTGSTAVDRMLHMLDVADRFDYADTVEAAVAPARPTRLPVG